jgi:AcrR family transcriptional regulator
MPANRKSGRDTWLEAGYRQFAQDGPVNLSINKISREIGSSRASFYHHFGDSEIFIDELLAMHWRFANMFIKEGRERCRNYYPDFYHLLAEHPITLRFHRQLFLHRAMPGYAFLFSKANMATAENFALKLFAEHYDLTQPEADIRSIWLTLAESWYSRLDPGDLCAATLQRHAEEIMGSVLKFVNSQLYETLSTERGS